MAYALGYPGIVGWNRNIPKTVVSFHGLELALISSLILTHGTVNAIGIGLNIGMGFLDEHGEHFLYE